MSQPRKSERHRTREPDAGGGGLAEEGSQGRVRLVAPRVVRTRRGDRGGTRVRLEIGAGVSGLRSRTRTGWRSPRHEVWCAAPANARHSHSPRPKRCLPACPSRRCCFARSRSVPFVRSTHVQWHAGAWLCRAGKTEAAFCSRPFQAS
jgi:hypothetical protein